MDAAATIIVALVGAIIYLVIFMLCMYVTVVLALRRGRREARVETRRAMEVNRAQRPDSAKRLTTGGREPARRSARRLF